MNFSTAQQDLKQKCLDFATKEIAPNLQTIEDNIDFRMRFYQKMAKEGLFGLLIPKEFGGFFCDSLSYALAMSAIAKTDAGVTVAMSVTNMVAETILKYGTEAQKKNYLPKIASGELVPASFALTEKQAGSDAKNIQTTAEKIGSDYVLNGEKQFISNADIAGVMIVFAKTENGITAFLVDKGTAGMSVTKKERKLGLLSANLVGLKFENCRVKEEQVLGPVNEGFKIALSSLDSGRVSIAAQSVGIGEAALEAALSFAKHRKQFGVPISEFEGISFKLANMHVKLEAAKLLLYKACLKKDSKNPYTLEASEAKLFCSETCNEIASEALQIHGGYGYIKDYPVEKYFRDARVTTLYEGTSEIQRLIIAKHVLA